MINFYVLCKKLFLKHEKLSDTRVVSITKKKNDFAVYFI